MTIKEDPINRLLARHPSLTGPSAVENRWDDEQSQNLLNGRPYFQIYG
jgi:hypothetical protein